MYFGSFMLWIIENNVSNGTTVGTNPHSTDWHSLSILLSSYNRVVNAGDFSGYDGSLQPMLLWGVLSLINQWYDDEYSSIREMMFLEIIWSWHVFDGFLFEWNGSMPSGNPLTTIINTLANKLLFRKCWYLLIDDEHKFSDNVYFCAQGDDNVFSVFPKFSALFNEFTVIKPLKELGMTYTTELKIQLDRYEPRPLEEIEFLKRGFVFNEELQRFVAPLRLVKALEMPYWTTKNDEAIVKEKTEVVLTELALRGRGEYDTYSGRITTEYDKAYGRRQGWFETTIYSRLIRKSHPN